MYSSNQNSFTHRNTGFTLVEAMVALVVLAVGMLGIAGLYIEGLRSGQSSVARTNAVNLAGDMADRIRANPTATVAYAGAGPGTNINQCVNGPNDCTADELAADDWFWWNLDVQNRLPLGANALIVVTQPTAFTTNYAITLNWPETGQTAPSTYTLTFTQ